MRSEDHILKVVSLDGHRISIRKIELKASLWTIKKLSFQERHSWKSARFYQGKQKAKYSIYFTENHIVFEFDQTVVVSRLIEGEYFRIDQMLSSDYETKVHDQ